MAALDDVRREALGCVRCPQLVAARTRVVFASGSADADLMLVGDAPRRGEDERGTPLAGQAGELLAQLLAEAGLAPGDAFVTTVVKCRPPANRDPLPQEAANCQDHLFRQLDLVAPKVVCPLGNLATKLLRGDNAGVRRLHGVADVRVIGPRAVRLVPLFHPAAALYARPLLEQLRADIARLPGLLALDAPEQPAPEPPEAPEEGQLGLF